MNVEFKSANSAQSHINATNIVADHLKWLHALIEWTFGDTDEGELEGNPVYTAAIAEHDIVLAVVSTMTAEEVVAAGPSRFALVLGRRAFALGYDAFDSFVDDRSKKLASARAVYDHMPPL